MEKGNERLQNLSSAVAAADRMNEDSRSRSKRPLSEGFWGQVSIRKKIGSNR